MTDLADALARGTRGRRLCVEYVARADETVGSAVYRLGRELDPDPGVRLRRSVSEVRGREAEPTSTGEAVTALVDGVDLTNIRHDLVREALQASVDLARYWQEPDGTDAVAALPAMHAALRRIARHVSTTLRDSAAPRGSAQFAVDWRPLADSAPLMCDPAAVLTDWTRAQREDEARAARERPADPRANWSGTWWSVPQGLVTTRGSMLDALELVEDSHGWEVATVIPVRGAGRTLEIRSGEDWAELCREYPMEVTASRRHDWFRVTGRDGRWVIPDWQRVAERWDAVHLTTLGYLSAATQLIEVGSEYASVIGGWGPDSTIWLADVVRESEQPREQWTRPSNDWRWIPSEVRQAR
ncbi:hypothetical protein M4I32_04120 [Microbacterium sp. LRZ72]|uniref:hypothetical protein n=1 Tax=Microbacterium sp. LRZ72 TaxID=2942481 RepID=UPI0029B719CC|nr:hypothetical protein [Microbacterium sp. LRZ72]MDX2375981.1 hypothetical protein [Microbacterium sp. LRZ72]